MAKKEILNSLKKLTKNPHHMNLREAVNHPVRLPKENPLITDEAKVKSYEHEIKSRYMPIRVYLHRRQSMDRDIQLGMRSLKKTRSKSKRNVKNLNQNLNFPMEDHKLLLIRSELGDSLMPTALPLSHILWIQMTL